MCLCHSNSSGTAPVELRRRIPFVITMLLGVVTGAFVGATDLLTLYPLLTLATRREAGVSDVHGCFCCVENATVSKHSVHVPQ